MKLTKREIFSIVILLLVVIIGILWIITTGTVSWSNFFGVIITVLGVIGTFSQWLFPPSTTVAKTSTMHNQSGIIVVESPRKQKSEEQKKFDQKQKRQLTKNKIIISIAFTVLSLLSITFFLFSTLLPSSAHTHNPSPTKPSNASSITSTSISGVWISENNGGYISYWVLSQSKNTITGEGNDENSQSNNDITVYGSIQGNEIQLNEHIINSNCYVFYSLTLDATKKLMNGTGIDCVGSRTPYRVTFTKQ